MDSITIQGIWQSHKKDLHVGCLEIRAINYILMALKHILVLSFILVAMDNTVVVAFVLRKVGSRSEELMSKTKLLFALVDLISCWMKLEKFNIQEGQVNGNRMVSPAEDLGEQEDASWHFIICKLS